MYMKLTLCKNNEHKILQMYTILIFHAYGKPQKIVFFFVARPLRELFLASLLHVELNLDNFSSPIFRLLSSLILILFLALISFFPPHTFSSVFSIAFSLFYFEKIFLGPSPPFALPQHSNSRRNRVYV